jgi:hypothetical protein
MNVLTNASRVNGSLASRDRKPKPDTPNFHIITLILGWLLLLLLLLASQVAIVFLVKTAPTLVPKIHLPTNSLGHAFK